MKTSLLLPPSLLVALGAVLSSGCGGGSVKAETRVGADVEVFDFDKSEAEQDLAKKSGPDAQQKKTQAALSQQGRQANLANETPLLGARHDLRLSPSVTSATCQCLAVALGGPTTAGLSWAGPVPQVDAQSQLVIGIGSEGVACTGNDKGAVASYKGYAVEGSDVIVTVESAKSGRPVTHGAIIPKPQGGRVYVRPAEKNVPFGRALDGTGRCALGG